MEVATFGLPQQFLATGKRAAVLNEAGLSAQDIARDVVAAASRGAVQSRW